MISQQEPSEVRENIRDKAIQSFLRYGIKNYTMDDLARDMGMSKKTLYKNYRNKVELLNEALDAYENTDAIECEMIYEQSYDPIENMFLLYRHITNSLANINPVVIFELQKYYPDIWARFNTNKSNRVLQKVNNNLDQGIELGIYRQDLNREIISLIYYHTIMSLTSSMEFTNDNFNKATLLREYLIYHLNGIASTSGKKLIEKYSDKYFN